MAHKGGGTGWPGIVIDPSTNVADFCVFQTDKSVWKVLQKYFRREAFPDDSNNVQWQHHLELSIDTFMRTEHASLPENAGPLFSDKQLRQMRVHATSLRLCVERTSPIIWRAIAPEIGNTLDLCTTLCAFAAACERIARHKRRRGHPSRGHAKELGKVLSELYTSFHKPNKADSSGQFLTDFEAAFLDAHNVAIGFQKRATRGHSEGARAIRKRAN